MRKSFLAPSGCNVQQGVALVQVLLISTIIAVLLIITVSHTQNQQKQVLNLSRTMEQRQLIYSQTNELLYTLLTQPLVPQTKTENELASSWNFYGDVQQIGDTQIRLYNLSSLINLQADYVALTQLLIALGQGATAAEAMVKQVQLKQQPFLNRLSQPNVQTALPIQHLAELSELPGWDIQWQEKVSPYIAMVPFVGKSPAYMPSSMLDLVLSETKADMIRTSRSQSVMTYERFYALSGTQPDDYSLLTPGPYLRLELTCCADSKGQALRRQLDIKIDPYDPIPLQILGIIDHQ